MNMDLNKQIVDQRIRKIVKENPNWFEERDEKRRISKAFVLLGTASYLKVDISEAVFYLTEGSQDAGIDAIHISDTEDYEFTVTIFQGKYKFDLENDSHFQENAIIKVIQTIYAIFDPSKNIDTNKLLEPKVAEIRSLISEGYIPSVKCVCLNNGLKWNKQGEEQIRNSVSPNQVVFEHFNHESIVKGLKTFKPITEKLNFRGKSIVENFNFKRVLIGKVSVNDIAALMNRHGDALLENNIRKYLGLKKSRINESIKETLLSEKSSNFYFFNNGITMVCSKFSHNALSQSDWIVNMEEIQIINGGQTCKTIQETIRDYPDKDYSDAFVLVRLYELSTDEHDELQYDITIATNSQNPVNLRDLRANEKIQKDLEYAVKELGYTYIRKREANNSSVESIPSTVAAEAIFSIWKEKPHITKFRKNELFGRYYLDVFSSVNAAQLVIAVLIFRFCESQRKKRDQIEKYPHLPYSSYFMAMLVGRELLSDAKLQLNQLTHLNFTDVESYFDNNKEKLFSTSNIKLIAALNKLYPQGYEKTELRRLSSTFRREDLLEQI